MEPLEEFKIEITTFVNPHLFWISNKNDDRIKLLTSLNKQMQDSIRLHYRPNSPMSIFKAGEIVAAEVNNKFYRAVIEDVMTDNHKDSYVLWLIDYGTMRETSEVFKLPTNLRKTPPLSIQASLNNVIYIEQVLDYNNLGQLEQVNRHVIKPSSACRQQSLNLIAKGTDFKFKVERKEDGILFGDVVYKDKDNEQASLRNNLMQTGVIGIDEKLFQGIADYINTYKESHLMIISKICNKEPYPLEDIENKNLNESCMTIVSKILDEFQYDDLLSFEDEVSEPLWKFNKSRNNTSNTLDNPTFDSESPDKFKSKKNKLMEKLWEHKKSSKSTTVDCDILDSSEEPNHHNVTSDSTEEANNTNKKPNSKIKRLCELIKQLKNKEKPINGTVGPNHIQRNIIFSPAGSERTFLMTTKKKPYKSESSDENSSDKLKRGGKSTNMSCIKDEDRENLSTEKSVDQDTTDNETPPSVEEATENNHTDLPPVQKLKIKQHCSCKQCDIWTKEENVFIENFGQCRKVSKIEGIRAQLLFTENGNEEPSVNIYPVDYPSMKSIEKQATHKLLVHSEIILNPIQQISKVAFHRSIQINLHRLEYREAKRIQSYTWPAILRNQHVFMIHGPQAGKTMAYLPVMLTFILEKHDRYDDLLKVAGGPIVIVLCGNTEKCEEIHELTRILLRNIKVNVSLVTYPLGHVNTSHTDMLITTPSILVDLLKNRTINFKRLCHLILEDGDIILTKYKETMSAVFELAQSMLKNRVFSKALQLIVCAEHWSSQIKCLIKRLQQVPIVCIGNYLEAALYGQMEFSIKFITSACKELELKQLLKDTHRIYRSVIICKESEIEEIQEILTFKGIDNVAVPSNMSREDILHLENVWTHAKGGNYSVLICSDFVLHTLLSVTCADVLIHYSLPKSWTKFVKRFSCLLEACRSPLDMTERKIMSKSIVLCDENCKDQMPKFFNYINSTELKRQLPEQLITFSQSLHDTEEEQKLGKEVGFCTKLKLHGCCSKYQCPRRHIVSSKLDVSDYLPKSGIVKFKIINVVDVVTYSIQLLQHVDDQDKIHEYDETTDVTEDLTATLRLSRKKIHNPVLGHHYVYYDDQEGNYCRCEVITVDEECIKIKLLDQGTIIQTMTNRLYRLPKEFSCDVKPRATIDAHLANYIPPFQDENFSAKSFYCLKDLLEQNNYKNVIFTGEVCLQLDNTLWLKEIYEEIILSDKIIPGFQLSRELLQKKLVENNAVQLNNLYKLCTDAGVSLPKMQLLSNVASPKKHEVNKQWAFLDCEQVNEVTFASAFSPSEIYVRLNKFSDLLYTLQKEIQQSIKKPNYPKLHDVTVGGVYLARDPDGIEYCRVIVLKKESDKALCFFVDFADESVVLISDLKYILAKFITKLPFQSISCSLYGVKAIDEDLNRNVVNTLYDYAHEPGTDIFRSLFLKVCKKETSDSFTPTRYSVILKDGFRERKCLINRLLIECGMVLADSEQAFSDFDIPIEEVDSSTSDEDLKEISYICKKTDELDLHLQANSAPPASEQTRNNTDYNADEMELFIYDDPLDFYLQLVTGKEQPSSNKNDLPAITAAPNVDYCTPDVYWSQTDTVVKLSIRLTDVDDYKMNLTKGRMFNFRTSKNDKTYCLKLMFYEHIKTMQHTSTGPEIRVTLNKSKNIYWPRLIISKQRARNIHYDITKIPSEEIEHRKFLQLPKGLDEHLEDLGEDDPMYTVYSDLDSDLDMELNDID